MDGEKSSDRHDATTDTAFTSKETIADNGTVGKEVEVAPSSHHDEEKGAVPVAATVEEPQYPSTWKMVAIILAINAVVFLVALDQTIIATAIPVISDQFRSIEDIGW